MSEGNKPYEELDREVINSDAMVIAMKERIVHIRGMMGENYAHRIEAELEEYIKINYRSR